MKLRRAVIIFSLFAALALLSPQQVRAQKPSARPSVDARPDGLTDDFIKANFSAIWQHDVASIQIGAPVKLKEAARIFQVRGDTLMFPVHGRDAKGWQHATYFYQDDFLH